MTLFSLLRADNETVTRPNSILDMLEKQLKVHNLPCDSTAIKSDAKQQASLNFKTDTPGHKIQQETFISNNTGGNAEVSIACAKNVTGETLDMAYKTINENVKQGIINRTVITNNSGQNVSVNVDSLDFASLIGKSVFSPKPTISTLNTKQDDLFKESENKFALK